MYKGPPVVGAFLLALASALAFFPVPCAAQDALGWKFDGFGTLGYVRTDTDEVGFVRDLLQDDPAFRSGSLRPDSRIGVQATYRLDPRFELVTQVVARDKAYNTLANSIEWAYAGYRPIPDLDLRLGRVGLDVFVLSDFRNVGYAYTSVRPPMEFYGWVPIYSVDGVDATYRITGPYAQWKVKTQIGQVRADIPFGPDTYHLKSDRFWDVTVGREQGAWRLKAGYSRFHVGVESPFEQLFPALEQVAAAGIPGISTSASDFRRDLSFEGANVTYTAAGILFNEDPWIAQAEVSWIRADRGIIPQGTMAYAGLGRSFGEDLTVFVRVARAKPRNNLAQPGDWTALGPEAEGLRSVASSSLNATRIDQRTCTLGMRWDFHSQAALKLQWDSSQIEPAGYGLWSVPYASTLEKRRVNLYSATVDFVF